MKKNIHRYIYIYIYIYISEVGGVSPTGKSYSSRSYVRASEAARGRGTLLFPWRGFESSKSAPAGGVVVSSCRVVPLTLAAVPLPNTLFKQF